jgi:hypothetical protein
VLRPSRRRAPFDIIAWLETALGLNLYDNLPGPTDSNAPVNTPFDALAEGQPFDIIGWLESVFGLNLYDNLPGPTE